MPSRRDLLVIAVVVALASPVLAQQMTRTEVHSDPDTDFTAIKSFGWKDAVSPAKKQDVHMSIIWYIERELSKKGLKKIQDDDPAVPDVFVRYYAKSRSSIEGTPVSSRDVLPGGPENLTTSFDLHKAAAGTLIVEIQRAEDNKALWRSGSTFSIDSKRVDAEVSRAIEILFRKYPAK